MSSEFKQCKVCDKTRLMPDITSNVCGDCQYKLIIIRCDKILANLDKPEFLAVAKQLLMV